MTLEAFEQSRGFEQGTDGRSGTREFLVVENDSTVTTQPEMDQVIRSTGVQLRVPDSDPVLGNLIPISVSVRTAGDKQIQYFVSFKYGSESLASFDTGTFPGDPNFVAFNLSQRPLALDAWRSRQDNVPDIFDGLDIDIGGAKLDEAGEPITIFIYQQELELKVRYEKFSDIPLKESLSLVSSRNNIPYLGAEQGYLLYTGMSVSRDELNSYNASFNFVWDEYKHRRQVPKRDQNGDIILVEDSSGVFTAEKVMLRQPFGYQTSFQRLGLPDPF